ncbi:MAG: sugar transferase [Bacteroidales bacterium]|nr:sugar transferase [Bacteroidales bacterium]
MIRIFDILFSFLAIVILSPALFIIALLIILNDGNSALYRQVRVGKNNQDFLLKKFRTMRKDADRSGLLTIGNDDHRITPIGKFLRKYKLDELPQLFNVIKGEMSIVGPRPEVRKYVDFYTDEQKRILTVSPGITDWASIEFINENDLLSKSKNPESQYIEEILPAKIRLNMKYIQNRNLTTYFKIITLTFFKIFK